MAKFGKNPCYWNKNWMAWARIYASALFARWQRPAVCSDFNVMNFGRKGGDVICIVCFVKMLMFTCQQLPGRRRLTNHSSPHLSLSLVLTFLSVVSAWNSSAASQFAFVSCSRHNSLYDCQNQPSLTVHVTMLHDQNSFAASWIYCLWQEHQSIIKCLLLCLIFAKFICRVAPGARYRICSIRFLARWHKSRTEPGLVVWDFCIVYYFC